MESVKVIIVGGGAAGLGAAKALGSKINYLLIEAQDYLGGRIRTIDAVPPNVVVDLGAQFIHGKTNNIVYEICQQLNCILSDTINTNNDMLVLTSNQTKIDSEIMKKAIYIREKLFEEAREKFGDVTIPTHYPFSDYLIENVKQRLLSSLSCEENLIDAIVEYFNQSELIENGCLALTNLSLAEYGSFVYLDGDYEYEFKNGGYRPLISYLKSFIPDDNRIRFNSEVIRVKYLKENHRLLVDIRHHDRTSESPISTIQCEHLIWTSSLGYLKENFTSIFADEIELIEQKQEAIDNLGFDTVNKVIMVYEKRFWSENTDVMILLHIEKKQSIQFSESLNEMLKNENVNTQVIETILQAIHQYDVLPSTDIPVLITWFGGPAALLLEDLSENLIGQICHEVLCYYLNIPSELNQPIRIIKSEWHKNRFIRGSYSYYSIKSPTQSGEQLRTAYTPDGIPRIQFAGEATHEKFYSTVHGALESGIREGENLLAIINE